MPVALRTSDAALAALAGVAAFAPASDADALEELSLSLVCHAFSLQASDHVQLRSVLHSSAVRRGGSLPLFLSADGPLGTPAGIY